MSRTEYVPVVDLLLDQQNARLEEEQASQQETYVALAKQQGSRLLAMASHIVQHGLDPTLSFIVTPLDDGRYRVVEGNRRLLALKAMDEPSIVSPAYSQHSMSRWRALADQYRAHAIDDVRCEVFDSETDARPWVLLRHTGESQGAGIVSWSPDEQDRYKSRHDGMRSPEGQVLDFIREHIELSEEAQGGTSEISTNIKRLLETPESREALGLKMSRGTVWSLYPIEEIAKSLGYIAEELRTQRLRVGQIYSAPDRRRFADDLPDEVRPDPTRRLAEPVPISELKEVDQPAGPKGDVGDAGAKDAGERKRKGKQPQRRRSTLAPRSFVGSATGRADSILREAKRLSVDQFPNAASLLLRMFAEFSIDHGLDERKLMTETERLDSKATFNKRLSLLVEAMKEEGSLGTQESRALARVISGSAGTAANAHTFNQYAHNKHSFPVGQDLVHAWDELQTLFDRVWS